jgi:hypothetical protein
VYTESHPSLRQTLVAGLYIARRSGGGGESTDTDARGRFSLSTRLYQYSEQCSCSGEPVLGLPCTLLSSGRTLKTAFASVHELSVHVHGRFLGTVHVHVPFVPENSCCTVVVHG